jgi:hypothetical protein
MPWGRGLSQSLNATTSHVKSDVSEHSRNSLVADAALQNLEAKSPSQGSCKPLRCTEFSGF